jgi:hypothetical protein
MLANFSFAVRGIIPRAGVMAILAVTALNTFAQSKFDEDFDDKNKSWEEIAIQLPPAPKQENLIPFYVSATATQQFAIDANSLSVGADGVVRYTVVTTSQTGARNVSYEGIRCQSYERKLYAFGRPDGSWSRSRRDEWERIFGNAANRYHAALFKDYFCSETAVAGSAKDIIARLRHNK